MRKITFKCALCYKIVTCFKGQKTRFCSRECYLQYTHNEKRCVDCGKNRCRLHSAEKLRNWRRQASKQELKAKSMQVAYRQASGRTRTLSLEHARALIINPPTCIYCGHQITWQELSIDHRQPLSRGGTNDEFNLVWVDIDCNMVKGSMTEKEYMDFLSFINNHPDVGKYLIPRLKSGGGAIYGRRTAGS